MDEISRILTSLATRNPGDVFIVVGVVVAVVTGGAMPRTFGVLPLVLGAVATRIPAAMTGSPLVEMLVAQLTAIIVIGDGLTRRGLLRVAVVGFALGSLGNVAVMVANGAMPFDDGGGRYTTPAALLDRYEPITDSTRLVWLADTIHVPGFAGLASPGDLLAWASMAAGIVALAHSPDGKGAPAGEDHRSGTTPDSSRRPKPATGNPRRARSAPGGAAGRTTCACDGTKRRLPSSRAPTERRPTAPWGCWPAVGSPTRPGAGSSTPTPTGCSWPATRRPSTPQRRRSTRPMDCSRVTPG